MIDRRATLLAFAASGAAVAGLAASSLAAGWRARAAEAEEGKTFPLVKSDDEWRRLLPSEQYRVLRGHGTEPSGSSPLDREKRAGTFHCAGCDQALFASGDKFESGTGWPSFTRPLDGAVGKRVDRSFFMTRTEVHCANCGGHLGHVFEDGPPPTGLRYCMNGIAMTFKPAANGPA
ncbi:Peptide methionine sulfoxide reductase MsrB 1 [Platysternon megacephalum]|uniref:Peptide-methionine (R)-S-oxide reductase n=1 Tax=Platysternon megacephalum TaxID=55544 RepID=A0A4D9DIR0_9SAUR|nr:Peptide methionine sulfoxide reductase MsrB 1 [Platysternon megacephalum]